VAPPFREVEVELIHGEGISRENELLELGAQKGLVEKSGSWYSRQGERLGQGREAARQYLKEHTSVAVTLTAELRAAFGLPGAGSGSGSAEAGRPPLFALAEAASGGPSKRG